MPLLHLMLDGALAAAEMLALLLVGTAVAAPATAEPAAALERPVQLHRLSTSVDVRLLGTLADVRVTQHLRNAGTAVADLGARLPAVDEHVDALRVVRGDQALDLLAPGESSRAPTAGHARLSIDEAVADALQLAPGAEATLEVIAARPVQHGAGVYRVTLPVALDADAPRATLVEQQDRAYLVVVPHRRATTASVVLRPTSGDSRWFDVGPVDPRTALLIPLRGHGELDDVAEGAVEVELVDGGVSHWSTVAAERAGSRARVQARSAE